MVSDLFFYALLLLGLLWLCVMLYYVTNGVSLLQTISTR